MKNSLSTLALPFVLSCAHVQTPKPISFKEGRTPDSHYQEIQDLKGELAIGAEISKEVKAKEDRDFLSEYAGALTESIKERICQTVAQFDNPRRVDGYISAGDEGSAVLQIIPTGEDYSSVLAVGPLATVVNNTLSLMEQAVRGRLLRNDGHITQIRIPELRLRFPSEAFYGRYNHALYKFEAFHNSSYMVFDGVGPYQYCELMAVRDISTLHSEWQPDQMFVLSCRKSAYAWDSFASISYDHPPTGLSLGSSKSMEWTSFLRSDQRSVRIATLYMMTETDILRVGFSRTRLNSDASAGNTLSEGSSLDAVRVDMNGDWPCENKPWGNNLDFPLPELDKFYTHVDEVHGLAQVNRPAIGRNRLFLGLPGLSYDLSVPLEGTIQME